MNQEEKYKKALKIVPHHKMGIKILEMQQLENLFPEYENLRERIEEHRKQIESFRKDNYNIDSQYNLMYDNIFSILGKRGAGKTSVVLTLKQILKQEKTKDIVLPIIMPEIIPQECSMIGWILSLLEESVLNLEKILDNKTEGKYFVDCKRRPQNSLEKEYRKVKQLCYSQFYRVKGAESFTAAVINTEQQTQNSFNFSHELVCFWDKLVAAIQEAYEITDNGQPLIYIIFDDVDLMPDAVNNLFSTIIKYLSHPNLVVFVTADEDLLYDVIEHSMNTRLGKYEELKSYSAAIKTYSSYENLLSSVNSEKIISSLNQKIEIIHEIPKLYVDKILPPSCRYYLRNYSQCSEKAAFIQQIVLDQNNKCVRMTLAEYMRKEIDRYLMVVNSDESANFLLHEGKFVTAYLLFWGDTSRQLANETLILREFITQLIKLHNMLEKEFICEEEYFDKLWYTLFLFANNTLNTMGNIGITSAEVNSQLEQLILRKSGKWEIYLNYPYLREVMERQVRLDGRNTLESMRKNAIMLNILMMFLENILIIESGGHAKLKAKRDEKIHGKGVLVDILDSGTSRNFSVVCKSQGRTVNEFLLFYERIIEDSEFLSVFDPTGVREARKYFQKLPDMSKMPEQKISLETYSRENPKWLSTIAQLLYFSNEGIYNIDREQIVVRKMLGFSAAVHDPYYENMLDEFRESIVETLCSFSTWKEPKIIDENTFCMDYIEELFLPGEDWDNNDYEVEDLTELEEYLQGKFDIDEKRVATFVNTDDDSTEMLLRCADRACNKLIELYHMYNVYKAKDQKAFADAGQAINKTFHLNVLHWNNKNEINKEVANVLIGKMLSQMEQTQNRLAKEWMYSAQDELERMTTVYTDFCEQIVLRLKEKKEIQNGKEIIKWNALLKVFQKYYLISYLRDRKISGNMRLDVDFIPYGGLYLEIREKLNSGHDDYLSQILKQYIREGCTRFLDKLWQV